jgi:hypothetical protein
MKDDIKKRLTELVENHDGSWSSIDEATQDIMALIRGAMKQAQDLTLEVANEYRGEGILADFVNVDDLVRVSMDRLDQTLTNLGVDDG